MATGWSNAELLASVEAYRLMVAKQGAGQSYSKKQIYEELAERFGRTAKAFEYRMQNISAVLDELGLPWLPGLKPAVNVGSEMKVRLIKIIQGETVQEKNAVYLTKDLVWEKALAAVVQLGGVATRKQVKEWILERYPEYDEDNLADLYMMSVNSPARTSYSQNHKPRRTDQGNRYDKLFKVARGTFEIYAPEQHGIWEIYPDPSSGNRFGLSVRQIVNPIEDALLAAEKQVEQTAVFDPDNIVDARSRVMAAIVRRRGQSTFRKNLMVAYGNACAITGCNLPAVLEAAHVHPYKGEHTNDVSNGLLLRADIHTLFDLGLIAIESKTMAVRVSPELKNSEYEKLDGSLLRQPKDPSRRVHPDALNWHLRQCAWSYDVDEVL